MKLSVSEQGIGGPTALRGQGRNKQQVLDKQTSISALISPSRQKAKRGKNLYYSNTAENLNTQTGNSN